MGLGGCGWAEETGGRSDFMDQPLVSREFLKFARAKYRTVPSSRQTFGVLGRHPRKSEAEWRMERQEEAGQLAPGTRVRIHAAHFGIGTAQSEAGTAHGDCGLWSVSYTHLRAHETLR